MFILHDYETIRDTAVDSAISPLREVTSWDWMLGDCQSHTTAHHINMWKRQDMETILALLWPLYYPDKWQVMWSYTVSSSWLSSSSIWLPLPHHCFRLRYHRYRHCDVIQIIDVVTYNYKSSLQPVAILSWWRHYRLSVSIIWSVQKSSDLLF